MNEKVKSLSSENSEEEKTEAFNETTEQKYIEELISRFEDKLGKGTLDKKLDVSCVIKSLVNEYNSKYGEKLLVFPKTEMTLKDIIRRGLYPSWATSMEKYGPEEIYNLLTSEVKNWSSDEAREYARDYRGDGNDLYRQARVREVASIEEATKDLKG